MEDESQTWLLLSHEVTDITVELLEVILIRAPPWLVNGLNGRESGVVAPSVEKSVNGVNGPVVVLLVLGEDRASIIRVDGSLPLTPGVIPMVEGLAIVSPDGVVRKARVIKSVLRSNNGMDVEEDLDSILLGSIEEPLNGVISTLSAANIGAVGLEGPVTNRKTEHLNFSLSSLLDVILGDPGSPMITENSVSFLGAEGLAEGVLIHTDIIAGLSKESVEERWGDPWLNDLPATKVGSDHGAFG